jgi:hypothetical protein
MLGRTRLGEPRHTASGGGEAVPAVRVIRRQTRLRLEQKTEGRREPCLRAARGGSRGRECRLRTGQRKGRDGRERARSCPSWAEADATTRRGVETVRRQAGEEAIAGAAGVLLDYRRRERGEGAVVRWRREGARGAVQVGSKKCGAGCCSCQFSVSCGHAYEENSARTRR